MNKKILSFLLVFFLTFSLALIPKTFANDFEVIYHHNRFPVTKGSVIGGKVFYITPNGYEIPMFHCNKNENFAFTVNCDGNFRSDDLRVFVSKNMTVSQMYNFISSENHYPKDTHFTTYPLVEQNNYIFQFNLSSSEESLISKGCVGSLSPIEVWDGEKYIKIEYRNPSKAFIVYEFSKPTWVKAYYDNGKYYRNQNSANVCGIIASENNIRPYDIEVRKIN